jgi:hypothetical protein
LLAEAEDEFQRFKKWSRHHDNLDEEVKKDADEGCGKKNHSLFLQPQEQADAGDDQQAD